MKLCLICNFQTASGEQGACPRDGSPMVTVGEDPLLGYYVDDRYRIQSLIGQGSAGSVYRARQELIGRDVAMKVLHEHLVSDDEFVKRFQQEAKAASRLSHANIITVYDFGLIPLGRRPYIAMELLDGTPLAELISQCDHIPPETAIPIFKMVCHALSHAHKEGVIHRDIKPENIVLVERSAKKFFPIVVDFGIARVIQEESDAAKITRTGTVCGSPTYMSPEQCTSSKVDNRSDIYSLAVVLFEALTGTVPFTAEELVKVMTMHLVDPAPTLSAARPDLHFPEALENVVARALSKQPSDRYQDMEEFAYVLDESIKAPQTTLVSMPGLNPKQATNSRNSNSSHNIKSGGQPLPAKNIRPGSGSPLPQANKLQNIGDQKNKHVRRVFEQTKASKLEIFVRQVLPLVFTVCALLCVITFILSEVKTIQLKSQRYTPAYAANLLKHGRYEEALPLLQDLNLRGKLDKSQVENLNKARIAVAKTYAHQKNYSKAVSLLQQIPRNSTQFDKAKDLIRRYKSGI